MAVKRLIVCFIMALVSFCVTADASALPDEPKLCVAARLDDGGKVLTVTVCAAHPQTDINAGMFALRYNKDQLLLVEDSLAAAQGIAVSSIGADTEKGYVWLDWFSPSAVAAADSTSLASVRFEISGNLSSNAIQLCDDTVFLDESLAGYGADGGALLCSGADFYSVSDGGLDTAFSMPIADEQGNEQEIVTYKTSDTEKLEEYREHIKTDEEVIVFESEGQLEGREITLDVGGKSDEKSYELLYNTGGVITREEIEPKNGQITFTAKSSGGVLYAIKTEPKTEKASGAVLSAAVLTALFVIGFAALYFFKADVEKAVFDRWFK